MTGLRATFATITAPETIDMSGVRTITSAAIIEFLTLARRVGARKISLLDSPPPVVRLFRVLGLDQMFLLTKLDGAPAPARTPKP